MCRFLSYTCQIMGAEDYLRSWISDKLFSLLGYSKPIMVSFVMGISKNSSSPLDIISKLVENGFKSSAETREFAEEIFVKLSHKASGLNSYQRAEKEAAMLARKQKDYAILNADDDDADDEVSPTVVTAQSNKVVSHSKHFRKKRQNNDSEENDEDTLERKEKWVRRHTSKGDDESDSEAEEARIRDQQEREELERRLREKDSAGTRKTVGPALTRREEEEAIRRSKAMEEDDISTLRKVSRREYLKKREQQKMDELRDDIEDEQYLFEGVKLTKEELYNIRYKREIYELAKKRVEDVDNIIE